MAKKRLTKQGFSIQGFDVQAYKQTESYVQAIDVLYNQAVAEFARLASRTNINPDKPFSFDDYPSTQATAQSIVNQLASKMQAVIEKGSREQWLYACKKNDEFVASIMNTSRVSKALLNKMQDRNLDALDAFQKRKVGGLDLSKRVWKYAGQFRDTMEMGIDVGIGEGKSAQQLSKDLRNSLTDPDKLFRRVRDKRGQLHLSKAAKAFHPGQGVYRSSYKNAMRLTRSEINMAYKHADQLRWQNLEFVVGYEVRLSNNHTLNGKPFKDICDKLAGRYPKNFVFNGWHPQCRCLVVPILQDPDEFDKQELDELKAALKGSEYKKYSSRNLVKDVPDNFKEWIDENKQASKNWSSQPYFIQDNFKGGNILQGLKFDTSATTLIHVQKVEIKAQEKPINQDKNENSELEKYNSKIELLNTHKEIKKELELQMEKIMGYKVGIQISEKDTPLHVAKIYAKELAKLCSEYTLEQVPFGRFTTKQNQTFLGKVSSIGTTNRQKGEYDWSPKTMNVGSKVYAGRTNDVAGEKSRCDADRLQYSTFNHEFAHNICQSGVAMTKTGYAFWKELQTVQTNYFSELRSFKRGSTQWNDIYLGKYAETKTDEFLAEAFQEYKNRKTPSKYAKLVGVLVDKYYKK